MLSSPVRAPIEFPIEYSSILFVQRVYNIKIPLLYNKVLCVTTNVVNIILFDYTLTLVDTYQEYFQSAHYKIFATKFYYFW